eukprot:Skav208341  [mRNA]  locus=scaffold4126:14098:16249:- [translate_table: standard]
MTDAIFQVSRWIAECKTFGELAEKKGKLVKGGNPKNVKIREIASIKRMTEKFAQDVGREDLIEPVAKKIEAEASSKVPSKKAIARRERRRKNAKKGRETPYKRVSGDSLQLYQKREIVRWVLAHEHEVVGSIDKRLKKEFPEYCSRRIFHWKKEYFKANWEQVSDRDARRWNQVPNWHRQKYCNAKPMKGPNVENKRLPAHVEDALEDMLKAFTEGNNSMQRCEPVSKKDIEATIESLQKHYNTQIQQQRETSVQSNINLLQQFANGEVTVQELKQNWQTPKKELSMRNFRHARNRSRAAMRRTMEEFNIPPELVLNYDQSWVNPYRAPSHTVMRSKTRRPKHTQTRVANVIGARKGVSFCTSSFLNGDPGPLFVSVSEHSLPKNFVEEMNARGAGKWFIWVNDGATHFMNSETTVRMYETLLSQSFDLRRERFGLHERHGLLMADAFSGNAATKGGCLLATVLL